MLEVIRATTPADRARAVEIRMEVFVREQAVPAELEVDEYDDVARHWLVYQDGQPAGTARAVEREGDWKIGRVAVRAARRGSGIGAAVMKAIAEEARAAGVKKLVLESQVHAIPFYERLGYVAEGPEYLDCGIPHRKMSLIINCS